MRANQLIFLNVPLMFCLISLGACEKKAETTERGASVSGLQAMPDSFAVNGSLNIPTEAAGVADAAGKTVQLLSDSGQVVAEAVTASSGSFQIQVEGEAGLKLQEESKAAKSAVAMPQLMRLRSLFLTNGAQLTGEKDALGLLKPLIIDPQNMKSASGTYSVDTGSHDAEKVGAIYGKISLETGADPTGIDVYIPGTTYIAKTDGEGQFLLGFLPAGTYEVRADKDGYNSIEWPKIAVKKQETTPLPDAVMSISVGPKIETFELDSLSQADGIASLRLRIKSATKYRISALADFSDTQFNPLDAAIPEFTIKFPLAVGCNLSKSISKPRIAVVCPPMQP